jgi:AraC-like DNA-binding protein/mannose-6-phosphate isomerase-like protein (cupin superfamily)
MNIINRMFTTTTDRERAGVLIIPQGVPFFANILHCTFRNSNAPSRDARNTHVHDVYHVVLVTGGKGKFVMGKKEYPVETGHLFMTSPGEWHSFFNAAGENTEYCEVTFEFRDRAGNVLTIPFHEMLGAWTGKRCVPRLTTVVGAELHGRIMAEIERMVRIGFSQQSDVGLFLNESLARLLLVLFSNLYREQPVALRNDPLQSVQEYIHKNYAERLSLEGLAKIAGFTPNYLSRRFKLRYGTTPIMYQHRLRIQAASNLLLTTEEPLKEIADRVGFTDIYFFNRMFKKYKGAPPGRFRKSEQNL